MRIIQLIDALDYGDGVSNDVINLHNLLDQLHIENCIYSKWKHDKVAHLTSDIKEYSSCSDDIIIYHFFGKSFILKYILRYKCKKIMRYHNITPPDFFKGTNQELYQNCKIGLMQLGDIIACFDNFLAVSPFNRSDLIFYGADPKVIDVLPIVMDLDRLDYEETDFILDRELKEHSNNNITFIGRIAPNKCFDDILEIFEEYYKYYDSTAKLYLVGNDQSDVCYAERIKTKARELECRDNIVFTGKVDDAKLYTYYKNASVFLCMSEHEGFCIPLLEAMHFGIPVLAYASSAIPDTMGGSGILLYKKEPSLVAGLLAEVLNDQKLRDIILEKQYENIAKYHKNIIREQFLTVLNKWRQYHV